MESFYVIACCYWQYLQDQFTKRKEKKKNACLCFLWTLNIQSSQILVSGISVDAPAADWCSLKEVEKINLDNELWTNLYHLDGGLLDDKIGYSTWWLYALSLLIIRLGIVPSILLVAITDDILKGGLWNYPILMLNFGVIPIWKEG